MERAPQSLRAGGERDIYIAIGGGCLADPWEEDVGNGIRLCFYGIRNARHPPLVTFFITFQEPFPYIYIHYIVFLNFFEIFSTMFVALAYFSFCLHSGEIHFLYRSAS